MIGSIGCYVISPAKFGKKKFTFNGTTIDLIKQAIMAGAIVGDKILASYGGGLRPYIIESHPHEIRTDGYWIRPVSN